MLTDLFRYGNGLLAEICMLIYQKHLHSVSLLFDMISVCLCGDTAVFVQSQ